ncbi:MAG: GNAT family N-acetyltransferase [Rhodospirillaceae bacterium]|nr:GNAT family N-acetyltransferase [Rhodospirillaceae bacterium]
MLDLNNAFAQELSFLTPEKAAHLVAMARVAARIGDADALLLAFDQDAAYDNPNFAWFKARYPRFVYVDRIVVAPAARGRGLAKALYLDLFRRARGHERVVCEVNADPPNPASDAFHAALGFEAVGGAQLLNTDRPASGKPTSGKPTSGKRVRYFSRALALE